MMGFVCIKQVEYQLSDMSLLANESLSKQISKDPEGYGKHISAGCQQFVLVFNNIKQNFTKSNGYFSSAHIFYCFHKENQVPRQCQPVAGSSTSVLYKACNLFSLIVLSRQKSLSFIGVIVFLFLCA